MRSTKEIFIRGVFFSLIPAVCSYLGSTNILNWAQDGQYIGKNVDVEIVKNIFFCINLIFSEYMCNF